MGALGIACGYLDRQLTLLGNTAENRMSGSEVAWDDEAIKNKGTAFPTEVATHTGRVQVADAMRTHQELVENAAPRVDTNLPYHVVHYQKQRKKNPDWMPSPWNQFVKKQQDKVFTKGVKDAL